MADRVVIGGSTHDTDARRRSMFNGFMVAFETAPAVPNDYPLVLTRQEIAYYWQRVKTWSVSTDLAVSANAEVVDVNSLGLTPVTNATRERDFAVASSIGTGGTKIGNTGGGVGNNSTAWNVSFSMFGGTYSPDIYDTGTDLKALCGFVGSLSAIDMAGVDEIQVQLDSDPAGLAVVTGSVTATVDGKPFTIYYDSSASLGTGTLTFTFFDLTPTEWWPYASKDGDPIYDTATGALLPGMSPTD